jgi:hypothetical protein
MYRSPQPDVALHATDQGLDKYAPAELDRLTRQMPVRDADVRCCIKCNERRADNAQEERSHLAAPLLSWELSPMKVP